MATHGGVDPQSQSSATNPITNNPHQAHPCPSCGHCPTCGRRGSSSNPYGYWPYWQPTQPIWATGAGSPNQSMAYRQYTSNDYR